MKTESLKNKKILITCGPTWIPIDAMRVISNKSTGNLGQIAAQECRRAGAKVTLLEGPVTQSLDDPHVKVVKFYFYDDFLRLTKKEIKKQYDIVIHAAAVSDYKLKKPFDKKISSQKKRLTLDLVPTQKIIHLIKKLHKDTFLVGFKLESDINQKTAVGHSEDLFKKAKCDLVIANNTTEEKYNAYLINKNKEIIATENSRKSIVKSLIKELKRRK